MWDIVNEAHPPRAGQGKASARGDVDLGLEREGGQLLSTSILQTKEDSTE